ncbi:divergent polysaccharide deacetylase family protein [Candidatus Poribacteria bacterium]|nr:divergent polysaccharide deacetylase family protein [Candidatus Poribacteria bacterium]
MAKQKNKNKSSSGCFFIILIIIISISVYYFYSDIEKKIPFISKAKDTVNNYLPQEDLSEQGLKIDQIVIDVLNRLGIQDKDVIEEYREEKKENRRTWVLINRKIHVSSEVLLENYQLVLTKELSKSNVEVIGQVSQTPDKIIQLTLSISLNNQILEKIIFIKKSENVKKKLNKQIAIIIDDFGNFYEKTKPFFEIPAALTFAILPQLTYSKQIAEEAHKKNYEIMLHFPMEAYPKETKEENPGPGTIYSKMSDEEINDLFEKNLSTVSPFISGINNHMGSKITEDRRIMLLLLTLLKNKNMYFIDSLVTNKSLAKEIAKETGVRFGCRDVFLDNIDDPECIKNQFQQLINIALKYNKAIGIGHVEKINTAKVITEMLPYLKEKDIEIVPISEIIE